MIKEILSFLYLLYDFYFILIFLVVGNVLFKVVHKNKIINKSIEHTVFKILLGVCFDLVITIILKDCLPFSFNGLISPLSFIVPYLIKITLGIICGYLYCPLFDSLSNFFITKFRNTNILNNKVGICTFIFLLVNLILNVGDINSWTSSWYALDYSIGFGPRLFIGTVLHLFYKDYLDYSVAKNFILISYLLIIILISYLVNYVYKNSKNNFKLIIIFLTLLYFCSPGSVVGTWNDTNMGRLENFCLLIVLFCIFISVKINNKLIKYSLITLLSIISIAIYQGNVFMYYPIIVYIYIFDLCKNREKVSETIKYLIVNIVFVSISFIAFQFCSKISFNSLDNIVVYLNQRTNLPISEHAIKYELFASLADAFNELNTSFLYGQYPREKASFTLLFTFPLVFYVSYIYFGCYKYYLKSNILKKKFILYLIPMLFIIPQYLLNIDWGRYMIATNTLVFTSIYMMILENDEGMAYSADKLTIFINKYKCGVVLSLIYLAGLQKFQADQFTDQIINVWTMFKELMRF